MTAGKGTWGRRAPTRRGSRRVIAPNALTAGAPVARTSGFEVA